MIATAGHLISQEAWPPMHIAEVLQMYPAIGLCLSLLVLPLGGFRSVYRRRLQRQL